MNTRSRNWLIFSGAVWGFVMAAVPSLVAFDDPFTVSPFLIAAHVCAGASGAVGFWLAGRRVAQSETTGDGWPQSVLKILGAGVFQALAAAPLAALSIWLMMAINMSGFSEENLGELLNILNIFREPSIWLESLIVAQAVFIYAVVVGLLLSPVSGIAIRRMSRS